LTVVAWTNFQSDALFETEILNFLKAVAAPRFSRVSVGLLPCNQDIRSMVFQQTPRFDVGSYSPRHRLLAAVQLSTV
jgi:hypothetical protein